MAANRADDNAIATDKQALLPGQTATFANYTSDTLGINGIMVDIGSLPTFGLTAADFTFLVGNSSDTTTWTAAPAPQSITIRTGAGADGSSRVEIIWANDAIKDEWVQVTVLADTDTGLAAPDVFYFGNAIGESGNSTTDAAVTTADALAARGRISPNTVSVTSPYDYNRDGVIKPLPTSPPPSPAKSHFRHGRPGAYFRAEYLLRALSQSATVCSSPIPLRRIQLPPIPASPIPPAPARPPTDGSGDSSTGDTSGDGSQQKPPQWLG